MPLHSVCLAAKTERCAPAHKARAHQRRQGRVSLGQVTPCSDAPDIGAGILLAKGSGHGKVKRTATGSAPDTLRNMGR